MNRPHPPEPAGDDDVARDAHLRAALRHAPDRDARPPAELSRRILDAARAAAGSAPKRTARPAAAPWARVRDGLASCTAWLRHPGATAAFASLMLATVIGVMWRDGPPPETEPVHDGATPAGPSTAPSASSPDAAADRPPARRDEPVEAPSDVATRDAATTTARRADNDDGARREAAAPRPRATGPAPSGPPAGKAAVQEKRSAAPEAANPPAASPPPTPMAASPAAPAVTPSDRARAAAQYQAPHGATAERSGLDDGQSAQAAPPDDPLAVPIAALRGSGGDAPARLARRGAAAAVAPSSEAGMPPSALAWFGDAQALTRGRWRPVAATPSAALPTAWTDALSTDGRALGRVAILDGALWWQPAGTDGRTWRAPLPAGDAAQRLATALASGALDWSPPPP